MHNLQAAFVHGAADSLTANAHTGFAFSADSLNRALAEDPFLHGGTVACCDKHGLCIEC